MAEEVLVRHAPGGELSAVLETLRASIDWSRAPSGPEPLALDARELADAEARNLERAQDERARVVHHPVGQSELQLIEHAVVPRVKQLAALPATEGLFISSTAIYAPGGFLGWHSNADAPGLRVYCIWAEEAHRSFFRYRDPATGRIVTDWEDAGWTVRVFRVHRSPPLWHCVGAACRRMALGFRCAGPKRPIVGIRVR